MADSVETRAPRADSYFVAAYPPFSSWNPAGAESFRHALERTTEQPLAGLLGLHVHIPFCVRHCTSCYYLSHDDEREEIALYLDALVAELELYAKTPYLSERTLSFIYFGGGTPSVLSLPRIKQLLSRLQSIMAWEAAREVTFECAPASVRRNKLEMLKDAGVNRISLGVQQLDDEVLRANGGSHVISDVVRAITEVRKVGFDVLNVDLGLGLLAESDRTLFSSLDRMLGLAPDSITFYHSGAGELPRAGVAYARIEEAGYSWCSAYTAVRDLERHAFVYQEAQSAGAELIGIGTSAFSYLDGVHQQNVATLGRYVAAASSGGLPLWRGHRLSGEERMVRDLALQLKSGRVDLARMDRQFGRAMTRRFDAPLAMFEREGLLAVNGRRVSLSCTALPHVDRMIAEFYSSKDREALDS